MTTVVFACPSCEAVYQTKQVRSEREGSFACDDCQNTIHKWVEPYDFVEWERID